MKNLESGVRDSDSTYWRGPVKGEEGYALAYVLILITILTILCAAILHIQLFRRDFASRSVDHIRAEYAANNGIGVALVSPLPGSVDSSFTVRFPDSSHAEVTAFHWGFFEEVLSYGYANSARVSRTALLANRLSENDSPALTLANLQHGLTLTGKALISGNVAVGPRGASTGDMPGSVEPYQLPVYGKVLQSTSPLQTIDTSLIDQEASFLEMALPLSHRRRTDPEFSGLVIDTAGYIDLSELDDTVAGVFSRGNLTLIGTVMKRGPPLSIVAAGNITLLPGLILDGPIAVVSTDSILIPPHVNLINSLIISPKSIHLQRGASITAQLIAPVINCASGTRMLYPSLIASLNLSDSSGIKQLIRIQSGASISGSVIMRVGRGIPFTDAVVDLERGSEVTGDICTDGYLTMDGSVDGFVRTFDLYFYKSPTTYLGWMRGGVIDRNKLPVGFLIPFGVTGNGGMEVLSWL